MSDKPLNEPFKEYFKNPDAIAQDIEHTDKPATPEEKVVTGKIIKISDEGWGFISSRDIKFTRIFFHWTSLKQDTLKFTELKNGMKVEFTPVEVDGKGWRAIRIRVIQDESKSKATA